MENEAYFITATGTDIGKTFVAEGLARAWRQRGHRVRALKPVMSGYVESDAQTSDAGRLLGACGERATAETVAAISPWRFEAPLSPDRAAALEGRVIDFDVLTGWCRDEIAKSDDVLLIEGVGGVMVPIDTSHTVRDWMSALGVPVLLVAGTYLGAVSHTLTALSALREAGIAPTQIILNESESGVGIEATLASLSPHLRGVPCAAIARGDVDALIAITESL